MAGLVAYLTMSGMDALFACLILLHAGAACVFYRMSVGALAPVPLCFSHAILCAWYATLDIFHLDVSGYWIWIAAAANRLFDLELLYLMGAAAYRHARLARA